MKDEDKTKEQLVNELKELRKQNLEMKQSGDGLKPAEEQIKVANERSQYLLSSTSAVIYTAEPSGDYGATFISENVEKMVGFEPRQFLEKPSFRIDHIHPEDVQHILDELPELFKQERYIYEYRFQCKDGKYIWVRDEMKLLRDSQGKPMEIIGCWVDITDRKQNEEAFRESEEQFRVIVESTPDAVIVSDKQGKIAYWNKSSAKIFGYEKEEALGKSVETLIPQKFRDANREARERIIRTGDFSPLNKTMELQALRKDGSELFIGYSGSVWIKGDELFFCSIMRDITERKKAEEALRESEERFRIVAQTAIDAIIFVDREEKIIFFNRAAQKLFGYDEHEIIGKSAAVLLKQSKKESEQKEFAASLSTGKHSVMEKPIESVAVRKDGTEIPIEISISAGAVSKEILYCGIIRDITERKQAEEKLQMSELFLNDAQQLARIGSWETNFKEGTNHWSDELYFLLGYKPGDVEPTLELYMNHVHPDDRDLVANTIYTSDPEDLTVKGEYRIIRKNGEIRHIVALGKYVHDDSGELFRVCGTIQDITESKQMEDKLYQEHEFLNTVLGTIEDGIVACNYEGILTLFNRATREFHGLPQNPIPSHEWAQHYDLYLADGMTPMRREDVPLFRALSGETVHNVEMAIVPKKGKKRFLLASGKELIDKYGNKIGAVVSMHDFTERKQAEEKLQMSELLLNDAQQLAHMGSWETNIDEGTNHWSDELYELLGYKPGDVEPTLERYMNHVHPDDWDFAAGLVYTLDPVDFVVKGEYRIVRKDGEVRSIFVQTKIITDGSGKSSRVYGTVQDITERKRSEEAVLKSEERFQIVTQSATDAIIFINSERNIVFFNRTAQKLFGYDDQEIIGKPATWLMTQSGKESEQKAFAESLSTGERVVMEKPVESVVVRKDGTEIQVEVSTFSGKVGKEVLYCGIIRDITERKHAENEIRKFKTISDNANYGTGIVDPKGNIVYLNECFAEKHGYTADELIGKHFYMFHNKEQLPRVSKLNDRLVREGSFTNEEVWHKRKDGSVFPMLMNATLLKDERGSPLFLTASAIDITELKHTEEELRSHRENLEKMVKERTAELRAREQELEIKSTNLEEANTTLRVLLSSRDKDRDDLEEKLLLNVKELVVPYIEKTRSMGLNPRQLGCVDVLESNLNDILSPFTHSLVSLNLKLSSSEIRVANLVKEGKTTKDIAEITSLSKRTIDFYRENIRKKLGFNNRKINLRTHLLSIR